MIGAVVRRARPSLRTACSRVCTAIVAVAPLMLAGCSAIDGGDGPPAAGSDRPLPADPLPRAEPPSRYGNPKSYVVFGRRYHVRDSSRGFVQRGVASWYGRKFHGRRTASGERYDMHGMTAAHKTLPLPTYVEVVDLETGRRVVVRVNDRGPFHDNRIIDLSYVAARKLGIVARGTGLVEIRALHPGGSTPATIRARAPATVASSAPRMTPAAATRLAPGAAASTPRPAPPRLYLQAGAFAQRRNAEELRMRLLSLGSKPVDISATETAGASLYRVRIGPLDDVAHADRLSRQLTANGLDVPRIVID